LLTGLYSFLENFDSETGNQTRNVLFDNQWIYTASKWVELTKANFTIDDTGRQGFRKDYFGGIAQNKFSLKNCGFFKDFTNPDQVFTRPAKGVAPIVDLNNP
jgi:Domain of unknown function (DUF3472)